MTGIFRLIPPEIIEQIRESASLVDYISRDIVLKKSGNTFKGLCPFHGEKTPSFTVYPEQNRFHCFGCGKSGDIFTYIKEKEGLGFLEAAESLAARLGIELPRGGGKEISERNRILLEANQRALQLFHHNLRVLPAGRTAMDYLTQRGLSVSTLDHFRLGYALPAWDSLYVRLSKEHYSQQTLRDCGLCLLSKDGSRLYDRFRNRVMFPIFNDKNDPVAFGGRILDDSGPKYLNSPETPLFQKRQVLYGLNRARKVIAKNDVAYLVEGYMDVIGMHQAGFPAAVAPLGTSLTEAHLARLKRLCGRLVFLFDGDAAGKKAVLSAARTVLDLGFSAKVVVIAGGRDAFDVSQELPRQEIRTIIKRGVPLVDFVLAEFHRETAGQGMDSQIEFLHRVYRFLDNFAEHVQAGLIVKKAAVLCGVDPDDALTDYKNQQQPGPRKNSQKQPEMTKFGSSRQEDQSGNVEFYLLRLIALHPEAWNLLQEQLEQGFAVEDARALFLLDLIRVLAAGRTEWEADELLERVEDDTIRAVVQEDISSGRLEQEWKKQYDDTILKLWLLKIKRERQYLSREIHRLTLSGNTDQALELQQDLLAMRRREEALLSKKTEGAVPHE